MKRMPAFSTILLGVPTVLMTCASAPGSAQEWPSRPMTMVVTVAAGSSQDVAARILAPRLSELLGQQVIVENIGGAGGMTGASRVAKAPPDGYQFVLGNVGTHAMNQTLYKRPLYNAATDFAPVGLLWEAPNLLITRRDLPADDLKGFIAHATANQAKMQYGSPGAGNPAHLACALFNTAIGVNVTHVPYRGGGPAMQDLIAGRIDYQCAGVALSVPHMEQNQVKAIAILSESRSTALPRLPTAREQGLQDFDVSSWSGFFLPKGAPQAVVRKLRDAATATVDTATVRQQLEKLGYAIVGSERRSPEYLQRFVESEINRWAEPIRNANLASQ